jgi:methylated-DNA-[protein]-cysteine S-methyltransferase
MSVLKPEGTEFELKVYQYLLTIPYGETRTYEEVAEAVGDKKAAKAVGMAVNRNPIPLFIPCHRVIGKKGDLVGYQGGIELKKKLLSMEKANMNRTFKPGNFEDPE